jgi:hypothetical protein
MHETDLAVPIKAQIVARSRFQGRGGHAPSARSGWVSPSMLSSKPVSAGILRPLAAARGFFIGKKGIGGTAVAFSQTRSTGAHSPGKDRENLDQRGPEFSGWSGMIAKMVNPGKACSIGLSRGAPRRTGEPGWLALDQS